jgi:hypothetical protein
MCGCAFVCYVNLNDGVCIFVWVFVSIHVVVLCTIICVYKRKGVEGKRKGNN